MSSKSSNPLGPPVADPSPRPWPSNEVPLEGRHITLVKLQAEHAESLYPHISGEYAHLWDYMPDGPFTSAESFKAALAKKATATDIVFYAILSNSESDPLAPTGNKVVGCGSYLRIDPANQSLEVGHLMFSPALQRTPAATEAMYLMAKYAFEDLGYRRYEWKCNSLNAPSRRAAHRLGFVEEGLFRNHYIVKGRSRDSAWFSMLKEEWPKRKAELEGWLDPANFDAEGVQKKRLEEFRAQ